MHEERQSEFFEHFMRIQKLENQIIIWKTPGKRKKKKLMGWQNGRNTKNHTKW